MTQAVNDFFLSDDMENFAIKNDDSQVFFKPDGDRSARIILLEAPLSRDTKSLISRPTYLCFAAATGVWNSGVSLLAATSIWNRSLLLLNGSLGPNVLTERTMVVLKTKIGIIPLRTQWAPLQLVGFRLF